MAQLIALTYPSEAQAQRALEETRRLSQGHVLQLADAVIAVKGADGGVRLNQSVNTAALGGAGGAFWGSLVGLLFLAPLAGAAVGAAAGALSGYLTDYGIDDRFMTEMSGSLRPGEAALFLLATRMTEDKVADAFRPLGGRLLYSSVSKTVEGMFAGGEATPSAAAPASGPAPTSGAVPGVVPAPAASVPPVAGVGVGTAPLGGAEVTPQGAAELNDLGNAR